MLKYSWKTGSRFGISADVAGAELDRIRKENNGILTPPAVVEASQGEDAPLHPAFTWDDARAAHFHRLHEARQVIYSLQIISVRDGEKVNDLAYLHLTPSEEEGPCYMTTAHVLGDDDLRDLALQEALTTLRGFQRRWKHLEELAEVFKAVEKVKPKKRKKQRA